jgi:3-polyprenyl-4-hydroxybenzoate decarboxylase
MLGTVISFAPCYFNSTTPENYADMTKLSTSLLRDKHGPGFLNDWQTFEVAVIESANQVMLFAASTPVPVDSLSVKTKTGAKSLELHTRGLLTAD